MFGIVLRVRKSTAIIPPEDIVTAYQAAAGKFKDAEFSLEETKSTVEGELLSIATKYANDQKPIIEDCRARFHDAVFPAENDQPRLGSYNGHVLVKRLKEKMPLENEHNKHYLYCSAVTAMLTSLGLKNEASRFAFGMFR